LQLKQDKNPVSFKSKHYKASEGYYKKNHSSTLFCTSQKYQNKKDCLFETASFLL